MSLISHYKKQKKGFLQSKSTLKDSFFLVANCLIVQNQSPNPAMYYLFLILEHLGMIWFLLHPKLNIYGRVYLLDELRAVLKIINFQEFFTETNNSSKIIILIVLSYLLFQVMLLAIASKTILSKIQLKSCKLLKKFLNLQIVFNVKVISGPVIGLMTNFMYCRQDSPYHSGQLCYQGTHLGFCILCGIILILILAQILMFSLFFFIRNPFSSSYLAIQNRNYNLSKTVIKIVMSAYFAVDYKVALTLVYCYFITALLGLYLLFHRFSSTHSYNQQYFYVQFFLESFLFWVSVNNLMSYLVQGSNTSKPMNFIYSIFCTFLIGFLMVNIEKSIENKFIEKCLQNKIKKKDMERFIFILINLFVHNSSKQSKMTLKVYQNIINLQKSTEVQDIENSYKESSKNQLYIFLLRLTNSFLKEYNSITLRILRCHLLYFLGSKCYSLHQALQIQQQKLGINDQFSLYQFINNYSLYQNQGNQQASVQFIKYYNLNQEIQKIQTQIELYAQKNAEYWNQLLQNQPSFGSLQHLAKVLFNKFEQIVTQYSKIIKIFPQNIYSTRLYLNFLMTFGKDTKQTLRIKEILTNKLNAQSTKLENLQYSLMFDENVTIITINSVLNNFGQIMNCNKYVKQSLGFDKFQLIGQNITKIMPKIYGDQHNNWLYKFIKGQQSSLFRPIDKFIPSLTKDSLLINLKLSVKIMKTIHSQFSMVGYLKQLPKQFIDEENGFLIYQISSLVILGIDRQLQKIMNHKITGSNVVSGKIKITQLLPKVSPSSLQNQICLRSMMEVGQGEDKEVKYVHIESHIITVFSKIQIGVLKIEEVKRPPTIRFKQFNLSVKKNRLNTSVIQENILVQMQSSLQQKDKQNIAIQQKLQQILKKKQSSNIKYIGYFIYIISCLSCTILLIFSSYRVNNKLSQIMQHQQKFHAVASLQYYMVRTNLLSNLIWSIQQQQYQLNYKNWIPTYQQQYNKLKLTVGEVIKITKQYTQDLQYNRNRSYLFKYMRGVDQKLIEYQFTTTNVNIINSFVTSAATLLVQPSQQLWKSDNLQINLFFVRINGDKVLPQITKSAIILFNKFVSSQIYSFLLFMFYIKNSLAVIVISSIIIIQFIGHNIKKTNNLVINVYREIKRDNLNGIEQKCLFFINKNKFKVKISVQNKIARRSFEQNLQTLVNQSRQQLIVQNPTPFSQMGTPAPLLSLAQQLDNEQSMINKIQNINIKYANNSIILTILVVFILIFTAGYSLSIISTNDYIKNLQQQTQALYKIAKIKNTINSINYFTLRVVEDVNNSQVKLFLNQYIQLFYNQTNEAFTYLGDPNPLLKNTYTYIEYAQELLEFANSSSSNISPANYSFIYQALNARCNQIEQAKNQLFMPNYSNIIQTFQKSQWILACLSLVLLYSIILVLHYFYLAPIYQQSRNSIYMIRMIPAEIFEQNQTAYDELMK